MLTIANVSDITKSHMYIRASATTRARRDYYASFARLGHMTRIIYAKTWVLLKRICSGFEDIIALIKDRNV